MEDVTATCRYCGSKLNFIRLRDDWDWCAHLGSSLCPSTDSTSFRHYPVEPVEGIDY